MNEWPCDNHQPVIYAATLAIYSLLAVVSLLANSIARHRSNKFVVRRCTSAGVLSVCVVILVTYSHLRSWPFGWLACKIYSTLSCIAMFADGFFLAIMCVECYIAVSRPRRTESTSVITAMTWIVSAFLSAPVFFFSNADRTLTRSDAVLTFAYSDSLSDFAFNDIDDVTSCLVIWPASGGVTGLSLSTVYFFALRFAMPLVIIVIFNVLIRRRLKRGNDFRRLPQEETKQEEVSKLMFAMSAVYVVCWMPCWIIRIALSFSTLGGCRSGFLVAMTHLSTALSFAECAMSPMLCIMFSDSYETSVEDDVSMLADEDSDTMQCEGVELTVTQSRT